MKTVSEIEIVEGAKYDIFYDKINEKIYSLNKTASFILSLLKDGFDKASVISQVKNKFAFQGSSINNDIDTLIDFCNSIGILSKEGTNQHSGSLDMDNKYIFRRVWIELTQNCNHTCIHCYAVAGENTHKEEICKIITW